MIKGNSNKRKIMINKIIAFLIAVIMILQLFMPYLCKNAIFKEIEASSSDDGVILYQANIIANGYSNSESYYKLFSGFQNPLYYEAANYMLEDKVLFWTSNFWNAAFNSDFQKNPSYFYEVIIMGFLKYEQTQMDISGAWDSKEMSLATKIYSELSSKYETSVEDLYKNIDKIPKEELEKNISDMDNIKITKEEIGIISKLCSYTKEFVNAVSEYEALLNAKAERIQLLKLTKQKITDNDYFTKAVDDIIEKMEKTQIEYVEGEMLDKIWDDFLDKAWDLITKDSPIAIVLKSIDIEKMVLDVLFNTSDTSSNNFKLLILYTVDTYFKSALDQSLDNYNNLASIENAATLIQCYRGYIEYQMYGLDCTKTFIKDTVDGGTIHHIIERIFFQENIKNAEGLIEHCDSQINSRQQLLMILDKSAKKYYTSAGLDSLVSEFGGTDINIPVTAVSFKQSEITLTDTEDICLIYADVYPENATNQKVVYTSSNPSILEVPENGGFATQKSKGKVTVTATTEDGGFTATQTVNVGYEPALNVSSHGKCGENVYYTLYNNGTLYINGMGNMYNDWRVADEFKYNNVDSVIISNGVTSIGDDVFCNCESLKEIIIPESVTSIGDGAFFQCISLKEIVIPNGVIIIGDGAFCACKSLKKVKIGESVTSIGYDAFNGCVSLKEIVIPKNVKSIGNDTFAHCESLTNIEIPNGVIRIGAGAFSSCKELTNVEIPNSVVDIDANAFNACSGLTKVKIPDSVINIGHNAFLNCSSLTEIKIPNSVVSIDYYAFAGCSSLTKIEIPSSVKSIGSLIFNGCGNNLTIYGEKNSKAQTYAKENGIPFCAIEDITSDDDITVTYNADDEAENLKLYTKELINTDEEYKNIDFTEKITDQTVSPSDVKFTAYEIKLLNENGSAVQPNNTVTVKIPCPSEYDGTKCNVYHIEEDGTFTDMKAEYKDQYLVFETNHFSTYLITETELIANSDIILGDVNNDGEVDIKDSALIKRYLAGWETEMDMASADMDEDGDVTIKDSALIKRQLAGWE